MKTQEFEIQELNAELTKSGVKVNYDLVDDSGVANVKQTIPTETLLDYIVHNDLNVVCTDVVLGDYTSLSAEMYLSENLHDVVSNYLEDNINA